MDSQTFFSVDTSMDLQQYQSTDMGTEIVMDNVDWIQGRAALNFLERGDMIKEFPRELLMKILLK